MAVLRGAPAWNTRRPAEAIFIRTSSIRDLVCFQVRHGGHQQTARNLAKLLRNESPATSCKFLRNMRNFANLCRFAKLIFEYCKTTLAKHFETAKQAFSKLAHLLTRIVALCTSDSSAVNRSRTGVAARSRFSQAQVTKNIAPSPYFIKILVQKSEFS